MKKEILQKKIKTSFIDRLLNCCLTLKSYLSCHVSATKIVICCDFYARKTGVLISLLTESFAVCKVGKSEDLILKTRNNFLATYVNVGMGATQLLPVRCRILIVNEPPTKKLNLNLNSKLKGM